MDAVDINRRVWQRMDMVEYMKNEKLNLNINNYYIEAGEGPALILLHGNGENSTYFEHQIDEFSKNFHIYAIDTRGHGKSPRGNGPFSLNRFAEDLFHFMQVHNIDKANILGFSDGGNIALLFALKYPEKIDKLILNGANLNTKGVVSSLQIQITIEYYIAKLFSNTSDNAKQKAEMLGLMVNEPNINPDDLSKLQIPTLVIAGTHDLIKAKHTRLIANSIRNSSLVFVEGDHCIAKKNHKQFNEAVLSFLNSN